MPEQIPHNHWPPDTGGVKSEYARLLCAISDGEINRFPNGLKGVYLNDTPVQAEDGTYNFKGVWVAATKGTNDQAFIPGSSDIEQELSVGVTVKKTSPVVRNVNGPADSLRVTLGFQALENIDKTSGSPTWASVEVKIEWQNAGDSVWHTVDLGDDKIIGGRYAARYVRSFKFPVTGAGPWSVKVTRVSDDDKDQYAITAFQWESYTIIQSAKLRYPNTTLADVVLSSSQFSSIPSVAFDIEGRVINVPDNYDPETRTYSGLWEGGFKKAFTNNPAWIYYDLATDPRYGAGRYLQGIPDIWSLYSIGKYCDEMVPDGMGGQEPRFALNLFLQTQDEALVVLQNIASVFRGMVYWDGNAVQTIADRQDTPVQIFNNANVVDGTFMYQGSSAQARHNSIRVKWNNPAMGYNLDVAFVEDEDAIKKYGLNASEIVAIGCTSEAQAKRVGLWVLNSELTQTEMVSFRCGLDALKSLPGQLIEVHDSFRWGTRMGGRLTAATLSTVTLDAPVTIEAGKTYTLRLMSPEGTSVLREVTSGVGDHTSLAFTPDLLDLPVEDSLWLLGANDFEPVIYRLTSITEKDGSLELGGLIYNPEKYAAIDAGVVLDTPVIETVRKHAPPVGLTLSHYSVQLNNSVSYILKATWASDSEALSSSAWYSFNGGSYKELSSSLNDAELLGAEPGDYSVRVQSRFITGTSSFTEASYTIPESDNAAITRQNRLRNASYEFGLEPWFIETDPLNRESIDTTVFNHGLKSLKVAGLSNENMSAVIEQINPLPEYAFIDLTFFTHCESNGGSWGYDLSVMAGPPENPYQQLVYESLLQPLASDSNWSKQRHVFLGSSYQGTDRGTWQMVVRLVPKFVAGTHADPATFNVDAWTLYDGTLSADIADALTWLTAISYDGLLSRDEKPRVVQAKSVIDAEYAGMISSANKYEVNTSSYAGAYSALNAYLADPYNPANGYGVGLGIEDWKNYSTDSRISSTVWITHWTNYYSAKSALQNQIDLVIKQLTDAGQQGGDSLIPNWTSEAGNIPGPGGIAVYDAGPGGAYAGSQFCRRIPAGRTTLRVNAPATTGKSYVFEAVALRESDGVLSTGMVFKDVNGAVLLSTTPDTTNSTGGPTDWLTITTTEVAPLGTVAVDFFIESTSTGYARFDNLRAALSSTLGPGSVLRDMIENDAIDATKLANNAVDSGAMQDGAVVSRVIAGQNIVASHLSVTNWENLWPNATSEKIPPATADTNQPEWKNRLNVGASAFTGEWVRDLTTEELTLTIPCLPEDEFYLEAYGKTFSGTTSLGMRFAPGGQLGGQVTSSTAPQSTTSGSWTRLASHGVAPAGVIEVQFFLKATGHSQFDAILAKRMNDGKLVVDGSIQARALETDLAISTIVRSPNYSHSNKTGFKLSGPTFDVVDDDGVTQTVNAEFGANVLINGRRAAVLTNNAFGGKERTYGNNSSSVTGSFTVPDGVSLIKITGQAPGGGGAGSSWPRGGGGGGAGAAVSISYPCYPGQTLHFIIGACGLAGAVNQDGTDGGNLTIYFPTNDVMILQGGRAGKTSGTSGNGGDLVLWNNQWPLKGGLGCTAASALSDVFPTSGHFVCDVVQGTMSSGAAGGPGSASWPEVTYPQPGGTQGNWGCIDLSSTSNQNLATNTACGGHGAGSSTSVIEFSSAYPGFGGRGGHSTSPVGGIGGYGAGGGGGAFTNNSTVNAGGQGGLGFIEFSW